MKANYHTHTVRCHHAVGDEREYIENAIDAEMKILGFSDHTPQYFKSGYVSGMRMTPDEAPGYVSCIKNLAEEYSGKIKIYTGFEAEYFPSLFPELKRFCTEHGVDYMIMGQHFLNNEDGGYYVGSGSSDRKMLKKYVDEVIEGINTGCFSYIAHPDVFLCLSDADWYYTENERLCEAAKALGIPLEINMLGLMGRRHYPSERFFKIAAKVGNDVIIGCDAHSPDMLLNTEMQKNAYDFAISLGLKPLEELELKQIR